VWVRGRELSGIGRLVGPGSAEFRGAVEATFRRIPGLAGQFGIRYRRGTAISAEQWRTIEAEGAVVAIALEA
jgi:hypothetical protein